VKVWIRALAGAIQPARADALDLTVSTGAHYTDGEHRGERMRHDVISTAARGAAVICSIAVVVSGCATSPSPPYATSPTSSGHTEPSRSMTPRPLATGQIPVPGQDVDAPVNGFDPVTVFTLCCAKMVSDYPNITNYRPYATADVSPSVEGTGVNVQLPFGVLPDGRPEGIMVCEVTGTPAAPKISYTGPVDV